MWQFHGDIFELFDTSWVTKSFSGKGGLTHTLAYIFTAQKELIADLHNPNQGRDRKRFHHSSITSGALVRCAGMIAGVQGKVTHIDNDSGHYQPPVANLARLVKHLNKRGAFANDAKVEDLAKREVYTVAKFLANS